MGSGEWTPRIISLGTRSKIALSPVSAYDLVSTNTFSTSLLDSTHKAMVFVGYPFRRTLWTQTWWRTESETHCSFLGPVRNTINCLWQCCKSAYRPLPPAVCTQNYTSRSSLFSFLYSPPSAPHLVTGYVFSSLSFVFSELPFHPPILNHLAFPLFLRPCFLEYTDLFLYM